MLRKHSIFILILALAVLTRLFLLWQSQTHVHSDEAIIGLMGKHISEGRCLPFYMYGQHYNAGAAWEAYLAAIPFALFGASVFWLKGCMVLLSLFGLVLLYRLAHMLYGRRTAEVAALVFALSPSLLKWHFQVRGYSWYFLSIPILTSLFLSIEGGGPSRGRRVFFFGLVSGLSLWCMELVLPLTAALWILLALRRKLSLKNAAAGAAGLVLGYSPAILYNLTHQCSNWLTVFSAKSGLGAWSSLFHASTIGRIFLQEMPKFFGPDTVLWYYPEVPASGVILYAVALAVVAVAVFPFLAAPSRIRRAVTGTLPDSDENRDFLMLLLIAASFVPYLAAPMRVAGYFLSAVFFLSILTARVLVRCFRPPTRMPRVLGSIMSSVILLVGILVLADVGRRNEIETLTVLSAAEGTVLARFPGKDIEAVQRHLLQNRIPAVWATISFVYPLIFESRENLVVSDAVFGWDHRVYPKAIPWRMPRPDSCGVFVIETRSPLRPPVEAWCAKTTGVAPRVAEYGTLAVIERRQQ